MLVKIHPRGNGGGKGPTGYLLGDHDAQGVKRSVPPEVLRGDPAVTSRLIDSLSFKRRYTSGVLSFSEPDIPDDAKAAIMDSWERCLFPGLDPDQYQVLWVEHRDKGRLELNFVIPNVELQSGKRLQPYFDKADRNRVDAWQTLTNDKHRLSDPKDPERARPRILVTPNNLPKRAQEAAEAITAGLLEHEPQNRAEVLTALQEAGFEIARETKSNLSIKNPDGGRNIRLTGALYEREFTAGPDGRTLEAERRREADAYRKGRQRRIREAAERYREGCRIRREFLQKRYQKPPPPTLDFGAIEQASVSLSVRDRVRSDCVAVPERQLRDLQQEQREASSTDLHSAEHGQRVGDLPRVTGADPERQDHVQSVGVDTSDRVRENIIASVESIGHRARSRTQSHELHAGADQSADQLGKIFSEIAERTLHAIGHITEFVQERIERLSKSKGSDHSL